MRKYTRKHANLRTTNQFLFLASTGYRYFLCVNSGSSGTRQHKLMKEDQMCHTARTSSSGSSVDQRGLSPKYESKYDFQG